MRKLLFLLSLLYMAVSGCTGGKRNAAYFNAQLDSLNNNLQRGIVDTTRLQSLSNEIEFYLNKNNADTVAPNLLFDLARTQHGHRLNERAVETLKDLRTRYPDSDYASKALMLEGFILANALQNHSAARTAYHAYLEKYRDVDPNLTRDVQMELQIMGKNPDEIMAEIEARNTQDTNGVHTTP
jgi:outer membrane protein assembly factor BamD (BamD/ComL family)